MLRKDISSPVLPSDIHLPVVSSPGLGNPPLRRIINSYNHCGGCLPMLAYPGHLGLITAQEVHKCECTVNKYKYGQHSARCGDVAYSTS